MKNLFLVFLFLISTAQAVLVSSNGTFELQPDGNALVSIERIEDLSVGSDVNAEGYVGYYEQLDVKKALVEVFEERFGAFLGKAVKVTFTNSTALSEYNVKVTIKAVVENLAVFSDGKWRVSIQKPARPSTKEKITLVLPKNAQQIEFSPSYGKLEANAISFDPSPAEATEVSYFLSSSTPSTGEGTWFLAAAVAVIAIIAIVFYFKFARG